MSVCDWPSVTVDMMCLTPGMLATASSTSLVTWLSSSAGAAPDWTTVTAISGMSMLGNRVTGSVMKLMMPRSVSTENSTIAGTGRRIDQAEMLRRITWPR